MIEGESNMKKVIEFKQVVGMKSEDKNLLLTKVKLGGLVFKEGFLHGVVTQDAIVAAGVTGLQQGLKYNGSLKRGVKGGLAAATVVGCIHGAESVIKNWNTIEKLK